MTVTLHLAPQVAQQLQEQAAQSGQTLEVYLEQLAEQSVRTAVPVAAPDLSNEEFIRLLDDLASGPNVPSLPADFSRAELYAEHD